MMELVKIVLRNIKHHKPTSLFLCCSIFFSMFLFIDTVQLHQAYSQQALDYKTFIYGDYQLRYNHSNQEKLNQFLKEEWIKERNELRNYGYIKKEDGSFIELQSLNHTPSGNILHLYEGRFPENENEIMVTKQYLKQTNHQLNDLVEFDISYIGYEDYEYQEQPFSQESDTPHEKITFTIVGIYQADLMPNAFVNDQMITYQQDNTSKLKQGFLYLHQLPSSTIKQITETLSNNNLSVCINEEGLKLYEQSHSPIYLPMVVLLVFVAILVISTLLQASLIAWEEKRKLIGQLNAIGMDNKQLFFMNFIESFVYCAMTLPFAFLASYGFMNVFLPFLSELKAISEYSFPLIADWKLSTIVIIACISLIFFIIANFIPLLANRNTSAFALMKKNKKTLKKNKSSNHIISFLAKQNKIYNKKKFLVIQTTFILCILCFICGGYIATSLSEGLSLPYAFHVSLPVSNQIQQVQQNQDILEDLSKKIEGNKEYSHNVNLTNALSIPTSSLNKDLALYLQGQGIYDVLVDVQFNNRYSLASDEIGIHNQLVLLDTNNKKHTFSWLDEKKPLFLHQSYWNVKVLDDKIPSVTALNNTLYVSVFFPMEQLEHFLQTTEITSVMSSMYIDCEKEELETTQQMLQTYAKNIEGMEVRRIENKDPNESKKIITIGISLLCMALSFLNFFMIMLLDIRSKRKQYQLLLNIGLETKQLYSLLIKEYMGKIVISCLFAIPFAILLNYFLYTKVLLTVPFFHVYVKPILLLVIGMLLLSIFIIKLHANRLEKQQNQVFNDFDK